MKNLCLVTVSLLAAICWGQTPSVIWHNCIGNETYQQFMSPLVHTPDGGFAVCGYNSVDGNLAGYVAKTDATGNVQWTRTIQAGLGTYTPLLRILPTSDGGYMCSGSVNVPATPPSSGTNTKCYVTKLDGSGNTIWENDYGVKEYNMHD